MVTRHKIKPMVIYEKEEDIYRDYNSFYSFSNLWRIRKMADSKLERIPELSQNMVTYREGGDRKHYLL